METNEIIGKHNGLNNYTIGQRKGLNIGGNKDRMYIVGKNIETNELYVALGENDYLISTSCIITNVNLLIDKKIEKYVKMNTGVFMNEIKVNEIVAGEITGFTK